jgi:hypothetical protein
LLEPDPFAATKDDPLDSTFLISESAAINFVFYHIDQAVSFMFHVYEFETGVFRFMHRYELHREMTRFFLFFFFFFFLKMFDELSL